MTILVTGSTGTIGSELAAQLAAKGAEVRALARQPEKARFPAGVRPIKGDLMDVEAMRAALAGADTLFLLNAVTPDEVTQALIALNLAREAGITRMVYFSVLGSEKYTNVPHFAGKHAVERMIEQLELPATILRPGYFMQNDGRLKDAVLGRGVYPMPIGGVGVSMIDTRDIAEIAASHLLRREQAAYPLPRETINLVGPGVLTGEAAAAIWAKVLNKPVSYGGDDLAAFERQFRASAPGWMAYDMRLMLARFQQDGLAGGAGDIDQLTALLRRPLRSYHDFAAETAKQWQA
ncbi:MAG: NmrA/HSCARG family protein [Methylocapsa sp.]|nr:NmrA/HSCARG family protein [Methylocapsa sp.]